ncbi:cytochrome P450 [Coniophora puteana RWD-64-598 SS2]|uniref:Cytochrome P450 n=1 Tax=Coniophora puteana (strain RWD-64-598) TaxID=741705 RepID=A0A5M3MEF1_CONPW|nr:cytochrome P450 [Coniophora puteana RWD-64-598 SS2]EIW77649.1 cytochrome P450 [Coniophora puteana RWD-64-598 SS2]
MSSVSSTLDQLFATSERLRPSLSSISQRHGALDVLLISLSTLALLHLARTTRRQWNATRLRGPPSTSFLTGVGEVLFEASDASILYEEWANTLGPAFSVSVGLGRSRVVLCDPRAAAHVYARDSTVYRRSQQMRDAIANIGGHNLLWAEGDDHKRHRRAMIPAFSNAAIRQLTPVFIDGAYKVKEAWEGLINESATTGSVEIDVHAWMSHLSLDSVGIAGFSHDFATLAGAQPPVATIFDSIQARAPELSKNKRHILGLVIPWLSLLPKKHRAMVGDLNKALEDAAKSFLERAHQGSAGIVGITRSEALGKGEEMYMSTDEVLSQMKLLILAGHRTTSGALTRILNYLAQHPEAQSKLRDSLPEFASSDPSYEQLINDLPYLDAVITECLRLQVSASAADFIRIADEDDVIPLSQPIYDASGNLLTSIAVSKSTIVSVPVCYMNRASSIWGPDSREFRPERWLDEDGLPSKAREIQGHRHILSFSDGQRACLGKAFALAEMKAVLYVLIRYFIVEIKGGDDTLKGTDGQPRLPRAAVMDGLGSTLRVKQAEQ